MHIHVGRGREGGREGGSRGSKKGEGKEREGGRERGRLLLEYTCILVSGIRELQHWRICIKGRKSNSTCCFDFDYVLWPGSI